VYSSIKSSGTTECICGHAEFLGKRPTPTKKRWETAERRAISVDEDQAIARRLKKRRSIQAVKVVPRSGIHGVIDWDRPIRQERPATLQWEDEKRVHANAALFRDSRAGRLFGKQRHGKRRRPAGEAGRRDERQMAGTPHRRAAGLVPPCPFFATASARTEVKPADSREEVL
jgi:hypothetical protein